MTLVELFTLSHKLFINSLVLSTTKLVEKVELPPADLSPTEALNQSLMLLKEVLACHDSAVISLDDKQKDFSQVCMYKIMCYYKPATHWIIPKEKYSENDSALSMQGMGIR